MHRQQAGWTNFPCFVVCLSLTLAQNKSSLARFASQMAALRAPMKEDFLKSKLKKETLMIYTDHPEGEEYNGIVLGISDSLLVFQDTSEFDARRNYYSPVRAYSRSKK